MTVMRLIICSLAIIVVYSPSVDCAVYPQPLLTNQELLVKLSQLEGVFHQQTDQMTKMQDRFDKELSGAHQRIDQLVEELSDARGKISSLEQKIERFSESSQSATYKHPEADTDNQSMMQITEVMSEGTKLNQKLSGMPRSCAEARSTDPTLKSGNYYVDPDGTNIGDDPISVYCDMTTGATQVSHDSEGAIDVGNCNNPGCYNRPIKYAGGATTKQLAVLVDLSNSCRQFIQYDCFGAPFEFSGVQQSWWNDRTGAQRYFWAGANINNNHTCQCGLDNNCIDPSEKCNCDAMAFSQVNDTGYLTDKNLLPVTQLNFGRVAPGAIGKHTLGKFECTGRATLQSMPSSCYELFIAGNEISGFFTVKGSATRLQTVYCDFSKSPNVPGYETVIGYNDVKTSAAVYFHVQRNTNYDVNETVIPYEWSRLNIGKAMDLETGVFTVPTSGRYHLSFAAYSLPTDTNSMIYLRVNEAFIGISCGPKQNDPMSLITTLDLKKNDTVDVYLGVGAISDNSGHFTQFSGFLIEEDLEL